MNVDELISEWTAASDPDSPDPDAMPVEHYRAWFTFKVLEDFSSRSGGEVKLVDVHLPTPDLAEYLVPFVILEVQLPTDAKALLTCGLALQRQPRVKPDESWAHLEIMAIVEDVHPLILDLISLTAAKVHAHDGKPVIKVGSRLRIANEDLMGIAESRFLLTEHAQISMHGGSGIHPFILHPVREEAYDEAGLNGVFHWAVRAYESNDYIKDNDVVPLQWATISVADESEHLPSGTELVVDVESGKQKPPKPKIPEPSAKDAKEAAKLVEKAREHLKKKDGAAALPLFEKAVKLDMRDATVISDYGRSLFMVQRVREAEEVFGLAIQVEDTPKFRTNRAIAREALQDWAGVSEDLREVLEAEPSNEIARWTCIRAMCSGDDLGGAISQLDTLVELNPQSAPGFAERARLNAKLGYSDQAVIDLEMAREIDTQDPHELQVIATTEAELRELGLDV